MTVTKQENKSKISTIPLYPVIDADESRSHLFQITGSRGGIRAYQKPGSSVPLWSVTTILGQTIAKPALLNWYNKQGREAVADKLSSSVGQVLTAEALDLAIQEAGKRPEQTKDSAAALGSRAHDLISEYITNKIEDNDKSVSVPRELSEVWGSFLQFEEEFGIYKWLASEFGIYSLAFQYAGSCDALCLTRDGKFILIDFKTSKALYPEHSMQVCAYANALSFPLSLYPLHQQGGPYGMRQEWDTWENIHPYVVRLGKDATEFEARRVMNPQAALDAFLNTLQLYKALSVPAMSKKARREMSDFFDMDNIQSLWGEG
jgi:hypothetical protein